MLLELGPLIVKRNRLPKEALKRLNDTLNRTFKFQPGLNLIIGPNGSGKSTIIKALLEVYDIDDYHTSTQDLHKIHESSEWFDPIQWSHDSEEVAINANRFFFEPQESKNIYEFKSAMDHYNHSQGEHKMLGQLYLKNYIESKSWDIGQNQKYPILIFDEPTLSMEPKAERMFFQYFEKWANCGYQIIIATNSLFCYEVDANFIELTPDYKKQQIDFLKTYLGNI